MSPFPTSLEALLKNPFLASPDWERFCGKLEKLVEEIEEGDAVLCAETDPVDALAVIFATILRGGGVFLGSAHWQEVEWEIVGELTGFHKIFGTEAIQVDLARAPRFSEARVMIPTGGTSGGLRFCVHSMFTLSSAVECMFKNCGGHPLNSISSLPVYHVSGLMPVMRAVFTGGLVQLTNWKSMEQGKYPKSPAQPCSLSLVPTQLSRLVSSEKGLQFLHGLDVIYIGGAVTSPDLVQFIRTEKLPVQFVYGMTETAAMVIYGTRGDTDESGAIFGQVLPGVAVFLGDGNEVGIKTKSLFRGYYPDDAKISKFNTGDLGLWVTDDLVQVLGRKGFRINTGGEKVNPEEVEALLAHLLPETGVAVGSQRDQEWGEIVVALIEAELPEARIEQLTEDLSRRLAPHKIPKRYLTGFSIPRTSMGKINRAELRTYLLEN